MSKIYVLYHANCMDGTGSKYAAWKKFKNTAEYLPVQYGKPIPKMEIGSEIYILDFSYSKNELEGLQAIHSSVVVLDHHKSAEEALRGLQCCQFDMHRSGAVMSWNYFHPDEPVPDLLLDIQDRDLWQFKRPDSKKVHIGLGLLEGCMLNWNACATIKERYSRLIQEGHTLLIKQDLSVKSYIKNKIKVISFLGFKCGITNSTDLVSEIGEAIYKDKKLNVDFALVYCITKEDEVLLSFRSTGDFDVSVLAQKFGGGGHKNASGAVVGLQTLLKIIKGNM